MSNVDSIDCIAEPLHLDTPGSGFRSYFGDSAKVLSHLPYAEIEEAATLVTAWANDTSYEHVFAEQIRNFIQCGDVAFAISGSGSSPNVLLALQAAREAGATNIGLTGFKGGKMKELCDVCIVIPSNNMQIIEDFHLSTAHALFTVLRRRITASAIDSYASLQRTGPTAA